jgi:hypothetical protein
VAERGIHQIFSDEIEEVSEYQVAKEIIEANSQARAWLIGGMVFRTIASLLYAINRPRVDLDFIVEEPSEIISLPDNWQVEKNRFGTAKLKSPNGLEIDFVPLDQVFSIVSLGRVPTIENFLDGVPLNVQSIAFDIDEKAILDGGALRGILDRVVEVNDFELALEAAKRKELSLEQYISQMAKNLGFDYQLPNNDNC